VLEVAVGLENEARAFPPPGVGDELDRLALGEEA